MPPEAEVTSIIPSCTHVYSCVNTAFPVTAVGAETVKFSKKKQSSVLPDKACSIRIV